jgi:hypothetical protein
MYTEMFYCYGAILSDQVCETQEQQEHKDLHSNQQWIKQQVVRLKTVKLTAKTVIQSHNTVNLKKAYVEVTYDFFRRQY